jgi:hypothetical protein
MNTEPVVDPTTITQIALRRILETGNAIGRDGPAAP